MNHDAPARPVGRSGRAPPTKRRFIIMGLLFVTVVITYLDRSNLSIAAPGIAHELALSPLQMGVIFSAFG